MKIPYLCGFLMLWNISFIFQVPSLAPKNPERWRIRDFWCGGWDLNPHSIATTGTWIQRVCQFRHLRVNIKLFVCLRGNGIRAPRDSCGSQNPCGFFQKPLYFDRCAISPSLLLPPAALGLNAANSATSAWILSCSANCSAPVDAVCKKNTSDFYTAR